MLPDTQFVEFGPFRLFVTERRLFKESIIVSLGGRALDVLTFLVENAGTVVTKQDLMARVWGRLTVEETNLRAQIAALRRALEGGQEGGRYIATVAGRGYCFVHHVAVKRAQQSAPPQIQRQPSGLPQRPIKIIGREAEMSEITQLLLERRFVTIHGAGGIGKTTVGLAVANGLAQTFGHGACFLDLSLCSTAEMLPNLAAAALGLTQIEDPIDSVVSYLRDRHMLLVFDCCEHIIHCAAVVAELVFHHAPRVSILVTSREPLRVEGEHVYPLGPLDVPPEGGAETVGDVLTYPAANLFLERLTASGHRIELNDDGAQVVADICRKVEGIALALELVAGRVSNYGLRETAAMLDGRLTLFWQGRRTASPRHQTLNAALEWSHELIGVQERAVFRRLSVFVGRFTLKDAQAVASGDDLDGAEVVEALAQLVQKSLVDITVGETTRYRLLDTTRAYAKTKLAESGEEAAVARRHARYCQRLLAGAISSASGDFQGDDVLGNVCTALGWSFSKEGDAELGVLLAVHAAKFFTKLALLAENRRWCEQALAAMHPSLRATWYEMVLCETFAHAFMFTVDNSDQVRTFLERALEIARLIGDDVSQFRLIGSLHMYCRRIGAFGSLVSIAQQARSVAAKLVDDNAVAAAEVMIGASYHITGSLTEAQTALIDAAHQAAVSSNANVNFLGARPEAQFLMARNLWLLGFPDRAVSMVREAERIEQPNPLVASHALILSAGLFHFRRDWATLEWYVDRLLENATARSMEPYKSIALGFKGEIIFRHGEIDQGIDLIRDALVKMRKARLEIYIPWLTCALADGLGCKGYFDQALRLMSDVIGSVEGRGGSFLMPELLRVHGELLARAGNDNGAEQCFARSIAIAEDQAALSWHLRTATTFAQLRARQRRHDEARLTLAPVYESFTEGFDTADLNEAKLLLTALS